MAAAMTFQDESVQAVTSAAIEDAGDFWHVDREEREKLEHFAEASPEDKAAGAQMLIEETVADSWWGGLLGSFF
jgi:hypothetical protein